MDPKTNSGAGAGTEQRTSGGMFDDLPGAPQAGGETDTYSDSETTTKTGEQTTENEENTETTESTETEGTEEQTEGETEEQSDETTTKQAKPIEVDGRTYKTLEDFITAHKNSSREGLRLAKNEKFLQSEMAKLKAKIFEMEEKADSKYPDEKSDEELALLPTHKQTEYFLKKQDWERSKATRDAERNKLKEGLGKEDMQVKAAQEANSTEMESNEEKYPGFKDLEATRKMVLDETPALARLPEAPYIAWLIAKGLEATSTKKAAAVKTEQAKKVAGKKAEGDAAGGRAPAGKGSNDSGTDAESDLVRVYKSRTGF